MPKKLLKGGFQGSTCEKEPGRGGKGKGKGKGRDERGERWGVGGGGAKTGGRADRTASTLASSGMVFRKRRTAACKRGGWGVGALTLQHQT